MGRGNHISEEERRWRAELGARIRVARRSRKMTALRLASRAGIHRNLLSAYERGVSAPTCFRLRRIAGELGVGAGWLLGYGLRVGTGEPMVCSPGATMGPEMLDPELRNRVAGKERRG